MHLICTLLEKLPEFLYNGKQSAIKVTCQGIVPGVYFLFVKEV